jgi:GNAT superfamily N-acetyltransferase
VADAASPATYRIEVLTDRHERAAFRCGVEPLERYLRTGAGQDVRKRVASCFVLVTGDDPVPFGYYTLAATGVALADLPAALTKRLPRYPVVPATLMGRLAVDDRHRSRRLGELLLFDAFSRALRSEFASYAFVVDAKDDTAAAFYARYRFLPLTEGGRRMFVPMVEIAKLFA